MLASYVRGPRFDPRPGKNGFAAKRNPADGSEHIRVENRFVECQIEIRLNGGEYVVMLGKMHTCTALRYKPAFIATW